MFNGILHRDDIAQSDLDSLPARYAIPLAHTLTAAVVVGVEDHEADDADPAVDLLDAAYTPIRVIDEHAVAAQAGVQWAVDQIVEVEVGGSYGGAWHSALLGVAETDILALPHPAAEIPAVIQRAAWLTA